MKSNFQARLSVTFDESLLESMSQEEIESHLENYFLKPFEANVNLDKVETQIKIRFKDIKFEPKPKKKEEPFLLPSQDPALRITEPPLLVGDFIKAGKYKNQHIMKVLKNDPNYVWWCSIFVENFWFTLSSEQRRVMFERI